MEELLVQNQDKQKKKNIFPGTGEKCGMREKTTTTAAAVATDEVDDDDASLFDNGIDE